ncbi:MAG: phosphoserine phosphatase, partial [Myxococcota bacterium]
AASAYFAANGQGLGERMLRLGGVALATPLYGLLGQTDRTTANRAAWLCCRNMSEDRIACLAEEYFDEVLKDKILDRGLELIKRARKAGHLIVLLSENVEHVITPLAEHIGNIDHVVSNRLEIESNECTGRLLDPLIGGPGTRKWVADFAAANDIDLAQSVAYAAQGPDLLLLAAVGKPCAVNPDFTLRKAAKEADWPVVEYSH